MSGKVTDELSHLQKEISGLTTILSLITKTAISFQEQDDQMRQSGRPSTGNSEVDLEMENEHLDEDEFEHPVVAEDAEVNAMKRKTLDRLAEVLARTKTARSAQTPQKRNVDAKHVTGVIMIEDLKAESATFIFSKNERFDAADESLLERLESLLQSIASNSKQNVLPSVAVGVHS
jgi:hypothetical protein